MDHPPVKPGLLGRQRGRPLPLLLLALLLWALPLPALPADAELPVPLAGPAWRALMAQPVQQDDTLAYHAAALAGTWGRPQEKHLLLAQLLQLHGQALAGQALPASLGEVLGRPSPPPQQLQAAWDAALQHAWRDPAWDGEALPAGAAAGATAWPGQAGFWRLPDGRLAASPLVENRARLVLVLPGPLQLVLQAGGDAYTLDCKLQRGGVRLLPGERARWWCTSRSAVPAGALAAAPQLLWSSRVPVAQAEIERWIEQLAGRAPASLAELTDLYALCRRFADCGQRPGATAPDPDAWARAQEAARTRTERSASSRDLRQRAAERWNTAALVVAAFGLYALVARALGRGWASVLSLPAVVALAWWMAAQGGGDGWARMAAVIGFFLVAGIGLVLVAAYHFLYRIVFGRT